MCERKPEVSTDGELKVLQKSEKEEGKTDSAKSSDGCCEPLCTPITCGP